MATQFSEIYNMFLSDVTDDTFLDYTEEDRELILNGLLIKSITRFKSCEKDLSDKTVSQFNQTLSDEEKLILSTVMRKFWFNDKLYSLQLIQQRMSPKDWKMTSQAEHMLRLTVLKQELEKEISEMIVRYTTYAFSIGNTK
jgi:hypothetical protein